MGRRAPVLPAGGRPSWDPRHLCTGITPALPGPARLSSVSLEPEPRPCLPECVCVQVSVPAAARGTHLGKGAPSCPGRWWQQLFWVVGAARASLVPGSVGQTHSLDSPDMPRQVGVGPASVPLRALSLHLACRPPPSDGHSALHTPSAWLCSLLGGPETPRWKASPHSLGCWVGVLWVHGEGAFGQSQQLQGIWFRPPLAPRRRKKGPEVAGREPLPGPGGPEAPGRCSEGGWGSRCWDARMVRGLPATGGVSSLQPQQAVPGSKEFQARPRGDRGESCPAPSPAPIQPLKLVI